MVLAQYIKAVAAVAAGVVAALGAYYVGDAPAWLAAAIPVLNALVVALAPKNAEPKHGPR